MKQLCVCVALLVLMCGTFADGEATKENASQTFQTNKLTDPSSSSDFVSKTVGSILQLLKSVDLKIPPELQTLVTSLTGGPDPNWLQICQDIQNQTRSVTNPMLAVVKDLALSVCFKLTTPKNESTDSPNNSKQWLQCRRELDRVVTGLKEGESWAMTMLDATGKPESGLLKGNLQLRGNNKECREVSFKDPTTDSLHIDGNMCSVFLPLVELQTRLLWNLCLPKSCTESDLSLALKDLLSYYPAKPIVKCTKEFDLSDDEGAIIAITILVLCGILIIIGTLMEVYINYSKSQRTDQVSRTYLERNGIINKDFQLNETLPGSETKVEPVKFVSVKDSADCDRVIDPEEKAAVDIVLMKKNQEPNTNDLAPSLTIWQRILLAFSLVSNTEKILRVQSAPGSIGCLHGIRVTSMGWIILGHLYLVHQFTFKNPKDLGESLQTLAFQLVYNAFFAVDTFFLLSGTLTCYMFLKKLSKKGKITIKEFIMYYVHRYWRLTPSLMIWMMIVANILKYVGEGSNSWGDYINAQSCRVNWWINIIYINNLYKRPDACIGVTWYLADDMQFYVVAPLALIPWLYGSKDGLRSKFYTLLGFIVCGVYVVIHLSSTFWLDYGIEGDPQSTMEQQQEKIYYKPYTRIAPYAQGLMLGWLLWKTNCKTKMNKVVACCGWIVCFGLILFLTLITYDITESAWPHLGRVVERSLSRPLWAVVVAWAIWACATGYGGYINSILSWDGWLPMSRLTYSAFLTHLTIMFYNLQVTDYSIMFEATTVTYLLLGNFVMAYVVGFILSVAVEWPMMALEKVVFMRS